MIQGAGNNAPVDRDGNFLIGPDYRSPAELTAQPGVPQGEVRQFTMDSAQSRFYPGVGRDAFGTVDPRNPKTLIVETHARPWQRAITVYVPAQLKRDSRAPFIVVHDGPRMGEPDSTLPRILDTLIAQQRVPAMVAVMIQNGGGDAQGSQRGLEYDTISGKFAEFIEAEVLPQVEARFGLRLTRDPQLRAVMGCSSGAAAAWTMAWFHPEWYRRVVSYSGTFVNQQWPFNPRTPGGAWDYHESIIARSPRKPIRIWMQVGDRDLYNPNAMRDGMHDWVAANHRMAAVLEAKGYAHQYIYSLDAGHCDRKVREQTLPQALEWVWRGALAPRAPVAAHPDPLSALASTDPTLAANKRLVFDMWREIVDAGREQRAARYVDASLIEHHPDAESGIAALKKHLAARPDRKIEPWIRAPLVALVAEGDFVAVVTMRQHPHPARPGRFYTTTWFDMFRIVNGRIIEHWDDGAPEEERRF